MTSQPPMLYPFQERAVEDLDSGKILCGGVGSGKSITSLVYFLSKECRHKVGSNSYGNTYRPINGSPDLFIITTARKRDSGEWSAELVKFGLTTGKNTLMGGITVTVDSWNNIQKYADVEDAFFIFDEQRVIGYGAWTKAFLKIAKRNRWILLSATPGDTWSDYMPVFIANGFYKNKRQFEQMHAVYSRWSKYPKIDKWIGEDRLVKIRNHILITMERPKETERETHLVTVGYDKNAFKGVFKDRWNPFTEKPIKNSPELMMCLRKIINTEPRRFAETVSICKKRRRCIIFYNLNCELEILRGLGKATGFPVAEWNGHVHDPLPDGKEWIYLVQYTAGCEGWNCITSDTVIFYSLNYSYKVMEQAAGRIDRLNTPYPVLHYYVIRSFSPMDIGIIRALKNKENFNESAFLRRGHEYYEQSSDA